MTDVDTQLNSTRINQSLLGPELAAHAWPLTDRPAAAQGDRPRPPAMWLLLARLLGEDDRRRLPSERHLRRESHDGVQGL